MRPILFHPTHRKFIKLLRKRVEVEPIYLTYEDKETFRALVRRTNIAMERHKGLYRIFLTAMRRPNSSVSPDIIIDSAYVDYIERALCEVERKNPRMLLKAMVLAPIARKILRILSKISTEESYWIASMYLAKNSPEIQQRKSEVFDY